MSSPPLPIRPTVQAGATALLDAARAARAILLTGPTAPDGDSIGACLALAHGLRRVCSAHVAVAGELSYRYEWMPGAGAMVHDDAVTADYDVVVVLDGDAGRLSPPVEAAFQAARVKGIIDHHRSTRVEGYDLAIVDADAASTCDLVYELLLAFGLRLDREVAQLLYAGIVYDTGGFRHSNTTPHTHRIAARLVAMDIDHPAIGTRILVERSPAGLRLLAEVLQDARFHAEGRLVVGVASYQLGTRLGAGPGDIEGIVDHLVYVSGVEMACFFIEQAPGQVKLSLRSRSRVDVAALARALSVGGGGHARAAGAQLHDSLDHALEVVVPRLEQAVRAAEA